MNYPVFCGVIVLTSANNRIRFKEGAGAVGNVDIPVGSYVLRGDGTSADLALALKTALDAFGGGGNTYAVAVTRSIDNGTAHTRITVTRTAGSSTFQIVVDGSTTFDMALIGFETSTANDSSFKLSTACGACWGSNDIDRERERVGDRVVSVKRDAAGGVHGVSRSARMGSYRLGVAFVDARRMKYDEGLTGPADTLEGFMVTFGAGAAFELHDCDITSGTTLEASDAGTLVDNVHFSEDTLTTFDPPRLAPGVALYALDMVLHAQVT